MERTGLQVISNLLTALKTAEIMKLFGLKPKTLLLLESVLSKEMTGILMLKMLKLRLKQIVFQS